MSSHPSLSEVVHVQPPIHVRGQRKERQVRNSCNACSSQKIRCGKERPKCHRCAEKGLGCEYSMSRRTGERSRVLDSPPRSSNHVVAKETVPATIAPVSSAGSHSIDDIAVDGQLEDIEDQFVTHDQQDIGWMLTVSADDLTMPPDLSATADLTLPMDSNGDIDMVAGVPQDYKSPTYGYNFNYILDQTQEPQTPRQSDTQQLDSAQPKAGSSHSELALISLNSQKADDCLTQAINILTYFHVPARGCLTSTNETTYSMQMERSLDDTPREVGTILSQNGKALRRLGSLLDCRCCSRQEVAVLICLGLHKAIGWYAEILGDDSVPQNDESQRSLLSGRIAKAPSFMGSYRLDSKAQRLLTAHLVLTQLEENVEPLMRKLCNLQSSPPSVSTPASGSTSSAENRSNLIEQHRQSLQEDIDMVIARANIIKQR